MPRRCRAETGAVPGEERHRRPTNRSGLVAERGEDRVLVFQAAVVVGE